MSTGMIYHAAAYLRLSRDDTEPEGCESNSIRSQRDLIFAYASRQESMEIRDVYADTGFSGTNFDRPQFQRMMEDIKAKKINCVIVKDLSRLGRDYIEAGRLLQKTFPAFHVRFISINDCFDSLTADFHETSLILPVKNFINDSYCRDISVKVRSHLKIKRENGEFTGAFCVYGYQKSEKNRNMLCPDAYAAAIVKKIFLWKLEGYSNCAIAARLDAYGILSPMEYKKYKGENYQTGFLTGVNTKWSSAAVKRILSNEVYTGTLIQGRQEKISYKMNKTAAKPESEWARVENAHPAIIAKKDFADVQSLFSPDIRLRPPAGEKKAHKYAGLLFCGDCGQPMVCRNAASYLCATNNKGDGCSRHGLEADVLDHIVISALRQQLKLLPDNGLLDQQLAKLEVPFEELFCLEQEIGRILKKQEQFACLSGELQEDVKAGRISFRDSASFQEIYKEKSRYLQQAAEKQTKMLPVFFKSAVAAGLKLEHIRQEPQLPAPDRLTLFTLIHRILIYRDRHIYIEFRFQNPQEPPL